MASCRLEYIENLTDEQIVAVQASPNNDKVKKASSVREVKDALSELHIDVAKILNANTKYLFKAVKNKSQRLFLYTDAEKEFLDWLKVLGIDKVVEIKRDESLSKLGYISINIVKGQVDLDETTLQEQELQSMYDMQRSFFVSDALLDFHSAIDDLVDNDEHEEVLTEIIKGILSKLYNYENSLKGYTDDFNRVVASKVLKELKIELEKNGGNKIKAISKYITEAHNQMRRFFDVYAGYTNKDGVRVKGIQERLEDLEALREEYKQTQDEELAFDIKNEENKLHMLLQQGRHVYHLFDYIEQINGELDALGLIKKEGAIADYYPEALTEQFKKVADEFPLAKTSGDELLDLMFQKGLSSSQIVEIMADRIGDKFNYAQSKQIFDAIDKALLASRKPNGSIISMLKNTLSFRNTLNTTFDKLYTDVLYSTLYPKYKEVLESVQKKDFGNLSAQEFELVRKGLEEDNLFLSPTQFKTLLNQAFRDTTFISHQLSAPVNIKDQFTKLIVGWMKDELQKVRLENINAVVELEKELKKLAWETLSKEDRDNINKALVYDTYELDLFYDKIVSYSPDDIQNSNDTAFIEVFDDGREVALNTPTTSEKTVLVKTINLFNQPTIVKVRKEVDLLKEYDSFKYQTEYSVFFSMVDKFTMDIYNDMPIDSLRAYVKSGLSYDIDALEPFQDFLATINQKYGIDLSSSFIYERFNMEVGDLVTEVKADIVSAISPETMDYSYLQNIVKNTLQQRFFSTRLRPLAEQEQEDLWKKHKMLDANGKPVEFKIGDVRKSAQQKFFSKNTSKVENKHYTNSTTISFALNNTLTSFYGYDFNSHSYYAEDLKGTVTRETKKIAILDKEGNLKYVKATVYINKGVVTSYSLMDMETQELLPTGDISAFYKVKGEFLKFTDNYSVEGNGFNANIRAKYNALQTSPYKSYHEVLRRQLEKSNDIYGDKRIKGLPKIHKYDGLSVYESVVKAFKDPAYRSEVLDNLSKDSVSGDYDLVEIDGKQVPVSRAKVGVDGVDVRNLQNKFSNYIPVEKRETDLFAMILAYTTGANIYKFQIESLPTVNSIRTKLIGDEKANIKGRQAVKRTTSGEPIIANKTNQVELVPAERLKDMLLSFFDNVYYGLPNEDTIATLGNIKINIDKVVNGIMNVSAYQALALNITSMLPNHMISTINNLSEAVMGTHFNREIFKQTYSEIFGKRILDGTYFKDLKSNYIEDKGLEAQAAIMFNAVQGEFMDKKGNPHNKQQGLKISSDVLMYNQNIVEYSNQLLTMMCLMKGFKLSDGTTLYENIDPTWKRGELLRFTNKVTAEDKVRFSSLIQGINRKLHGNYADVDKNMLQKTFYGKIMMMFKRWIYDTVRNRWAGMDLDIETRTMEEGYFLTYIKMLTKEYSDLFKQHGWSGMYKKEALPSYLKAGATVWGKSLLGAMDSATFRLASKNSSVKDFLYGKTSAEKQARAIERATAEMGIFLQAAIIALLAHSFSEGLDDDEDPKLKWFLKYVEYNAFKMQADLGFYMPNVFTGGVIGSSLPFGYTIDTITKFSKDPFTMTRFVDVNLGLIRDLFGVNYTDEGMNWRGNDVYLQDGNGYKKGDYKIMTKIKKSVVAPYWQFVRFLNPEDQLEYLDMLFKK